MAALPSPQVTGPLLVRCVKTAFGRAGTSIGLLDRTRALFYLLALISLTLSLAGGLAAVSADAAASRVAAAAVLMAAWTYRYQRHGAPAAVCVVEILALLAFMLSCADPGTVLPTVFALLWFRSVYDRTWRVALYVAGLCAAVTAGVLLWNQLAWHPPLASAATTLGVLPVLLLAGVIARYVVLGMLDRDRAQHVGEVLTQLGNQLLAAPDREETMACCWRACEAICAAIAGLRVVSVAADRAGWVVDGHAGVFAALPAAFPGDMVAASAVDGGPVADPAPLNAAVGVGCQWQVLRRPALSGYLLIGAPRAVPADGLTAIGTMRNQVALALRNAAARESLEDRAHTDPLTGLSNGTAFDAALAGCRASLDAAAGAPNATAVAETGTWVLFIDLDDFKVVNDARGHAAGDRLLRTIADRIAGAVRGGDLCARLGGDEFAVLLRNASANRAQLIAERLIELISAPVSQDGRLAQVGASIGLAELTAATTADEVVQKADLAMYAAKDAGKNRVRTFDPSLLRVDDDAALAAELRAAISARQFAVAYQPIVAADGRCIAVEALIRWNHPERGLLGPATFLDVAEARGLHVAIGAQLLRQSLADVAAWSDAGQPVQVHVNASAGQLSEPGVVEFVEACLAERGLPAHRLVVELTESAALDTPAVRATVHALDALGVGIALDDFGTGYAALTGLRDLPIDVVKIDKSFVSGAATSVADEAVLHAVVEMARRLGLMTVAEGVETIEQQAFVVAAGVKSVQGYLHAPPLPADRLAQWLADRAAVRALPVG